MADNEPVEDDPIEDNAVGTKEAERMSSKDPIESVDIEDADAEEDNERNAQDRATFPLPFVSPLQRFLVTRNMEPRQDTVFNAPSIPP